MKEYINNLFNKYRKKGVIVDTNIKVHPKEPIQKCDFPQNLLDMLQSLIKGRLVPNKITI